MPVYSQAPHWVSKPQRDYAGCSSPKELQSFVGGNHDLICICTALSTVAPLGSANSDCCHLCHSFLQRWGTEHTASRRAASCAREWYQSRCTHFHTRPSQTRLSAKLLAASACISGNLISNRLLWFNQDTGLKQNKTKQNSCGNTQPVTFPACKHSMERAVHKTDKAHNFLIFIRSSENVR